MAYASDGLSTVSVWSSPYTVGVARCSDCKLSRDGGNGGCPLPADLNAARAAAGDHDCEVFAAREVIAKARKVRKNLMERDWRLSQDGLF